MWSRSQLHGCFFNLSLHSIWLKQFYTHNSNQYGIISNLCTVSIEAILLNNSFVFITTFCTPVSNIKKRFYNCQWRGPHIISRHFSAIQTWKNAATSQLIRQPQNWLGSLTIVKPSNNQKATKNCDSALQPCGMKPPHNC